MLLAIKDSNLGKIIIWDYKIVDENKVIFEIAFWVFGASIDSFNIVIL
jgi:3-keto-L-gulonate-6-phosphate decarboxylase